MCACNGQHMRRASVTSWATPSATDRGTLRCCMWVVSKLIAWRRWIQCSCMCACNGHHMRRASATSWDASLAAPEKDRAVGSTLGDHRRTTGGTRMKASHWMPRPRSCHGSPMRPPAFSNLLHPGHHGHGRPPCVYTSMQYMVSRRGCPQCVMCNTSHDGK